MLALPGWLCHNITMQERNPERVATGVQDGAAACNKPRQASIVPIVADGPQNQENRGNCSTWASGCGAGGVVSSIYGRLSRKHPLAHLYALATSGTASSTQRL